MDNRRTTLRSLLLVGAVALGLGGLSGLAEAGITPIAPPVRHDCPPVPPGLHTTSGAVPGSLDPCTTPVLWP